MLERPDHAHLKQHGPLLLGWSHQGNPVPALTQDPHRGLTGGNNFRKLLLLGDIWNFIIRETPSHGLSDDPRDPSRPQHGSRSSHTIHRVRSARLRPFICRSPTGAPLSAGGDESGASAGEALAQSDRLEGHKDAGGWTCGSYRGHRLSKCYEDSRFQEGEALRDVQANSSLGLAPMLTVL